MVFARRIDRAGQPPRLRIGRGAAVERSEAEARGREIFAKVLYGLVPNTTAWLVSDRALDVERAYQVAHDEALHAAAGDPDLVQLPYSVDVLGKCSPPFAAVLDAKWAVIEEWQQRFRLYDDWVAALAWETMRTAREMQDVELEYSAPLVLGALSWVGRDYESDAYLTRREVVFEYGRPIYPVFVDDLKLPTDEGGFDMYTPLTEDLDTATKRLLEALRPRVRHALESIVAEHHEQYDDPLPVAFRKSTAFEWLVRFQVLGESRADIARELARQRKRRDPNWQGDHKDYASHVGREIRRVADLIGLTLRDA